MAYHFPEQAVRAVFRVIKTNHVGSKKALVGR